LRAMTVCGIAELALEFFEQDFAPARHAVGVCNFFGPEIGVVFRGVITHADCYICVERANRCGTGRLKRVTHGGSEMIGVAVGGHQSLAPALTLNGKVGFQTMGVLAKRAIIHGAINRESTAETTKLLATTAAIRKEAYDASGTSEVGGNGSDPNRSVAHSFDSESEQY
jgi:hypothetical protein